MDIIIGAGVTGLSFALFDKSNKRLIIEKDAEIGGYCKTICKDGFVWDYSGHFFHFQNPEIKELVYRGLNKAEQVHVKKSTKIFYKGKLIDFPFQKNIHQLDKEEFIDCLYDLFMESTKGEQLYSTFKQMLYSKLGKSIAEKFLIPYNEKLYATDLDNLDADAMGRFFPKADLKDIISNFKAAENGSYNGEFNYSRNGAIDYVNSIANQAQLTTQELHLNEEVISVDIDNQIVITNKNSYCYDRLISTLPFNVLLDKVGLGSSDSVYTYNQVFVFNLGFDKKGPNKEDHWIYFPQKNYIFYRVGFYDNILGTDRTSLYVEIGFSASSEIPNEEEMLNNTLHDLLDAGVISGDQKLIAKSSVLMNPAYVHINEKSTNEVAVKKEFLKSKNVYSIGRYGSWTYCSIEDNIKEAQKLYFELQKNQMSKAYE